MTRIFLIGLLFLTFAGTGYAQETVEAVFDERQWTPAFENYNPEKKAVIKEYVPEGETKDSWREMVTLQFFEGLQKKVTIEQFLQKVQGGLQKVCPGVGWTTVSSSETEAVYEWNLKGCAGQPDQTEIARVMAGEEGVHVWHYAAKDPDLSIDKKKEWIDRLNLYRIKKA